MIETVVRVIVPDKKLVVTHECSTRLPSVYTGSYFVPVDSSPAEEEGPEPDPRLPLDGRHSSRARKPVPSRSPC